MLNHLAVTAAQGQLRSHRVGKEQSYEINEREKLVRLDQTEH
jgi:hypothetical protein